MWLEDWGRWGERSIEWGVEGVVGRGGVKGLVGDGWILGVCWVYMVLVEGV